MSSRAEGTNLVTCAVAAWLWRQGARTIVAEVGLHATRGLSRPWHGRWRVDIAAAVAREGVETLHVIEVKGSAADIAREDLGTGKWVLDFARLGVNPWLAVADTVAPAHWQALPAAWGVMQVSGDRRVRLIREPADKVDHSVWQPNDNVTHAYRALAEVLTAQSLPSMMGRSHAQLVAALDDAGWQRPWRQWSPDGRLQATRDDDDPRHEDGYIL